MTKEVHIHIPEQPIAEICQRYGVVRLSLFGSVLRDDFSPTSDIDILVEFPENQTPSLFELGGLLMDLQALISRPIDLKTPAFLSDRFRDQVLREVRTVYAA